MKKIIALSLAVLLLVGLTACGDDSSDKDRDKPTTTVTTEPTAPPSATDPDETDAPTTNGAVSTLPSVSDSTTATRPADGTTATTRPSAETSGTTEALPTGVTVPIGTKPTTTTTTTAPTTTTRTEVEEPTVSGGSTTATTTTTTTTTTTITTTVPTTKPTEPEVQGPYIVLPAVGSDIDVTKKKDRIRISGVAAWFNEDGTIGVQLTFKNYTTNWITEETDYVTYTCYDKNGKVVQKATNLMIGVIDTKKHPEKSYIIDVPANTAEVKITKSKITYWTEWS